MIELHYSAGFIYIVRHGYNIFLQASPLYTKFFVQLRVREMFLGIQVDILMGDIVKRIFDIVFRGILDTCWNHLSWNGVMYFFY